MKIGQKLILGFLTVAILVAVVGYIGVSNIIQAGESFDYSEKMEMHSLIAALEIESAARQASIKAIEYSITYLRGAKKCCLKTSQVIVIIGSLWVRFTSGQVRVL